MSEAQRTATLPHAAPPAAQVEDADRPARARVARGADLLRALVRADLLARFGRGRLRALKWLADPFAALGVYLALVVLVLDRPGRAVGLSLACAVVPFQLVMMSIVSALRAVDQRKSVLRNMAMPRALLPVAATLTESVAFGASFALLALMMAVYGIAPGWGVAFLPLAVIATFALAVAFAYPATLLGVWFPAATPFVVSLVRTLFFLAPGLVALDQIYGHTHDVVKLNPVTGIFEAFRDALLYDTAPAAWELLYPLAFALALLAAVAPLYRREQRHFAKLL